MKLHIGFVAALVGASVSLLVPPPAQAVDVGTCQPTGSGTIAAAAAANPGLVGVGTPAVQCTYQAATTSGGFYAAVFASVPWEIRGSQSGVLASGAGPVPPTFHAYSTRVGETVTVTIFIMGSPTIGNVVSGTLGSVGAGDDPT